LDAQFFIVLGFAVTLAGVSKGGFGGGVAFVSSAILALIVPPTMAVGIMLPLLMVMDAACVGPFWKRWDHQAAWVLIIGGIPGVVAGAALISFTNDDVLRFLIGAISIGFVLWSWLPKTSVKNKRFSSTVGYGAGFTSGFTSFVSHAGGPPAAIYLLGQRMDKTTYHATAVLVFWVINALKAVPYGFLGFFTWETLTLDLYMIPFALFGVYLGVKAHHLVSDRVFFSLTYVLLACTGTKLIWDSLT
jgi:uncharacterized membrane protein YfcA